MADKNIIWDASIKSRREDLVAQADRSEEAADGLKNQDGLYAGEMRALVRLTRAILALIDEHDAAWKSQRETFNK